MLGVIVIESCSTQAIKRPCLKVGVHIKISFPIILSKSLLIWLETSEVIFLCVEANMVLKIELWLSIQNILFVSSFILMINTYKTSHQDQVKFLWTSFYSNKCLPCLILDPGIKLWQKAWKHWSGQSLHFSTGHILPHYWWPLHDWF